jgi:hypothetical protein
VDTAANAFITPFKERLHNYHQFKEEVQVNGFGGKPEVAVGSGSITLIDSYGNRQTLNDVVYVPECTEQILSLMKLRRLYGAGFEEFNIPFPNGVLFSEKSVNDVLYIWESTSLVSNAVTTRSASRKRKIVEIQNDVKDVEFEDVSPQSETFRPNTQPIGERELQREPSSSSSLISPQRAKPLYCSPNQLWHLRFDHASTTTLRKLPYIKSSHDYILQSRVTCLMISQIHPQLLYCLQTFTDSPDY